MMSGGQGGSKACERRQKAGAREAATEAQSGASAMATVGQATQIP
jgi:hypothetical protein